MVSEGIFINGEKVTFTPENILTGDVSAYTEAIGEATQDWLDEHLEPGGSVPIDDTLTIAGAAADAKKTGDEISELKEDLTSERYYVNEKCTPYTNAFNPQKLNAANDIKCVNGVYIGTNTAFLNVGNIPVSCEANAQYTLSLDYYTNQNVGNTGRGISVIVNYSDATNDSVDLLNTASEFTHISLTTDANKTVSSIDFIRRTKTGNIFNIKNIMLAKGTTEATYVPYLIAKDNKARDDISMLAAEIQTAFANLTAIGLPQKIIPILNYGTIRTQDGADARNEYKTTVKTVEYLSNILKIDFDASVYKIIVFYYASNYTFASATQYTRNWTYADLPANTAYIRFEFFRNDTGEIVYNDLVSSITVLQSSYELYSILKNFARFSPMGNAFSYSGEKIVIEPMLSCNKIINYVQGQDGVVIGDNLFTFGTDGTFYVHSLKTNILVGTGSLDPVTSGKYPHCNSASIGVEKNANDYPYVYLNAYNAEGLPEGTCYVYSLAENNGVYTASIVQTIQIGFTEDTMWDDGTSNRPYGNFIIDPNNEYLYVFTINSSASSRVFKFALPAISDGANIVLNTTDIIDQFDLPFIAIPQGCDYSNGQIFIISGSSNAILYAINLEKEKITATVDFYNDLGLTGEPECVAIYKGKLLASVTGYLYELSF